MHGMKNLKFIQVVALQCTVLPNNTTYYADTVSSYQRRVREKYTKLKNGGKCSDCYPRN